MNVWNFSGRVGQDAELHTTPSGETVLRFSVANEIGPKANRVTQWVACSYWGKRGAAIANYVKKGDLVNVSGEVKLEEFQRRNGTPGSKLAVRVNDVDLATRTEVDRSGDYNQDRPPPKSQGKPAFDQDLDDEIPF